MVAIARVSPKILKFKVPIIIEPDGQHYYAHSPALFGLHVGGDTKEEALQNARDGAIALLHSMIRDGDSIPLSVMVMKKKESVPLEENQLFLSQEEVVVSFP